MTIIGIAAQTHGFNVDETRIGITKIMAEKPRRVGEVVVEFGFSENDYSDQEKAIIENAARTCPVAKSLHPETEADFLSLIIKFFYYTEFH